MQQTPNSSFESFFKQFTQALPKDPLGIKDDLEKNIRAAMQMAFNRMNLITREEFDVQSAVLLRTREKLEALEARVAQLEVLQGVPPVAAAPLQADGADNDVAAKAPLSE